MTKDQIIEKVNYFLIDEFEADEDDITPQANLKTTLDQLMIFFKTKVFYLG